MNNPRNDVIKEVYWIRKNFDFIDLTLEMPKLLPEMINKKSLRNALQEFRIIGHTGPYLTIGSPFEELRMYALNEHIRCMKMFSYLGVEYVNVHLDTSMPMKRERHTVDFNIWTLKKVVAAGRKYGVKVMVENMPGLFSRPSVLAAVFRKVPNLYFHLDVGHANIGGESQTPALVKKFAKKLAHIHISDNNGKEDQHLALGRGKIKWKNELKIIKDSGYDNTITLEVFSGRKDLMNSKAKLRKMWNEL